MKNILIYPHASFSNEEGGIVVQYNLAKLLDEYGVTVRVYQHISFIDTPIFTKFYNNEFPIDDNCVVIYCEGIQGNPLNAKYVVRWMLSELGQNVPYNTVDTWGKNELVYYFNSELKHKKNKEKVGNIYKLLTTLYVNPGIKNMNLPDRKGYCHTIRKTHIYKHIINYIHPSDSFEIVHNYGAMKIEDVIQIFNKYEYFISYDPITFLFYIAALCGCIPIVYPMEGKTKQEWLQMNAFVEYMDHKKINNIYGIAYGINDLEWAKNTIHLAREQYDDMIMYYKETHVPSFIQDINNFDIMTNTIENNFYN
jgi:hypothetical protein